MFHPDYENEFLEKIRMIVREENERFWKTHAVQKYPEILTNDHLCEIFQCKTAKIYDLVKIGSFPIFPHIQAHYPRDLVFKWIEENSTIAQVLNPKLRAI
ncbi:hypothetical protein [Lysinibacillus fusiformis]|uniref:hypothetical protein n=1 Tax=Lysinibacillus fusiformis TaxID=28031 RepID=UPI00188214AF|nr:hypothetical protein [Lysinibacillus fusiformis]MBD8521841.1 hypothetical protein [Lysinibacillus fusiformis]